MIGPSGLLVAVVVPPRRPSPRPSPVDSSPGAAGDVSGGSLTRALHAGNDRQYVVGEPPRGRLVLRQRQLRHRAGHRAGEHDDERLVDLAVADVEERGVAPRPGAEAVAQDTVEAG